MKLHAVAPGRVPEDSRRVSANRRIVCWATAQRPLTRLFSTTSVPFISPRRRCPSLTTTSHLQVFVVRDQLGRTSRFLTAARRAANLVMSSQPRPSVRIAVQRLDSRYAGLFPGRRPDSDGMPGLWTSAAQWLLPSEQFSTRFPFSHFLAVANDPRSRSRQLQSPARSFPT